MKRLRNIIFSIVVIVVLLKLIDYTGKLFNPKWTDRALDAVEAFHSLPEQSIEVVVYGSSHAWKGVETTEMYEKHGINAYNYGGNWQHINTTSLFIKDSLRTQSPKIALIETYRANAVLADSDLNGEIYYTKKAGAFKDKYKYLRQCFGNCLERYVSYYIPLITFHENWGNLEEENFDKNNAVDYFLSKKGYEGSGSSAIASIKNYKNFEQYELNNDAIIILNDIVSLCRDRGIEVIFFTVPYEGEYHYADAMEAYAEANGCAYLNLFERMDEVGINGSTDFRDIDHLNDNGARKVADYIGEYIRENYDVADARKL